MRLMYLQCHVRMPLNSEQNAFIMFVRMPLNKTNTFIMSVRMPLNRGILMDETFECIFRWK